MNYDRTSDLVVTGDIDTVFGSKEFKDSWEDIGARNSLRSHAWTHEQNVTIIGYNGAFDGFKFTGDREICRYVGKGVPRSRQ